MEVGKSGRVSPGGGVASQDTPVPFTNYTFAFLEVCQKKVLGVCVGGWMCVSVWMCVFGGEMTLSSSSTVLISRVIVVSHEYKARIFSSPYGNS